VTTIEKLAFKDLYLAKVNLSHNEISKIEPDAFENCANITSLDLSYNKIDNISKYSFDSASYAMELQLSYNLLTSLNQVSAFFKSLINERLDILYLRNIYILYSIRHESIFLDRFQCTT